MHRFKKYRIEIILLALLLIGLCGGMALMELRSEEPRRAIVAMEMVLENEWIVPKIHGSNYYNKPPLFNWLMAGIFKLSGSFSETWVRMPSMLSFWLTAFLVFLVTKRHADKRTGFIAAVLYLVAVDILYYGAVDTGEIDLFLTLLVFVQGLVMFRYSIQKKWLLYFLTSYALTAVAVLTKGLPILIIQGIALLVWLTYCRQFKVLFSWQHMAGLFLFSGIVSAYFYAYSEKANVGTFLLQLINETTQRSAIESRWIDVVLNILQAPWQLFYICLPATALLLYLFRRTVRHQLKQSQLFVFSFIFTLINIIPYLIGPNTPNRYLYPAFPFIAIMGAMAYKEACQLLPTWRWLASYKILMNIFIFLATARILYNYAGIPYQERTTSDLVYRRLCAQLLDSTRGNAIYLTGFPERLVADPMLPFVHLEADTATIPPVMPYQIPYYLTKATNQVMRYDLVAKKDIFYLAPTDFLVGKNATVYFRFFDKWMQRDLALVRFDD